MLYMSLLFFLLRSENEVNNYVMEAPPQPQPDADPWGEAGRIAQSVEKRSRSPLRRCVIAKVTSSSSNL